MYWIPGGAGSRRFGDVTKKEGGTMRNRYVNSIEDLRGISHNEKAELSKVSEKFMFLTNDYYLSLIDWDNPHDPIRRIVIPDIDELDDWGRLDASDEEQYTVMPGLQHKYDSTALLLVSNVCGGICRYCFRKRIFIREHMEVLHDLPRALNYINEHKEITNVLLTGGDPLRLPTSELGHIIKKLRKIDHVHVIRIGTRMLSYDPYRILDDPKLIRMIEKHTTDDKRIYVMTHFSHPRELTTEAKKAIRLLQRAGALLNNQTPLVRGVNDDPYTLAELFKKLAFVGVPPYYVFQCRPASGNKTYAVPIEEGYAIFEQAKSLCSGLAKRARFVMSHTTGKLEILGMDDESVYFKYHRAAETLDMGYVLKFAHNPAAYWFDDYEEMSPDHEPYFEQTQLNWLGYDHEEAMTDLQ
jgi:lysine 2,3-aminomutase